MILSPAAFMGFRPDHAETRDPRGFSSIGGSQLRTSYSMAAQFEQHFRQFLCGFSTGYPRQTRCLCRFAQPSLTGCLPFVNTILFGMLDMQGQIVVADATSVVGKPYSDALPRRFTSSAKDCVWSSCFAVLRRVGCTASGAISARGASTKCRSCSAGCGSVNSAVFTVSSS